MPEEETVQNPHVKFINEILNPNFQIQMLKVML